MIAERRLLRLSRESRSNSIESLQVVRGTELHRGYEERWQRYRQDAEKLQSSIARALDVAEIPDDVRRRQEQIAARIDTLGAVLQNRLWERMTRYEALCAQVEDAMRGCEALVRSRGAPGAMPDYLRTAHDRSVGKLLLPESEGGGLVLRMVSQASVPNAVYDARRPMRYVAYVPQAVRMLDVSSSGQKNVTQGQTLHQIELQSTLWMREPATTTLRLPGKDGRYHDVIFKVIHEPGGARGLPSAIRLVAVPASFPAGLTPYVDAAKADPAPAPSPAAVRPAIPSAYVPTTRPSTRPAAVPVRPPAAVREEASYVADSPAQALVRSTYVAVNTWYGAQPSALKANADMRELRGVIGKIYALWGSTPSAPELTPLAAQARALCVRCSRLPGTLPLPAGITPDPAEKPETPETLETILAAYAVPPGVTKTQDSASVVFSKGDKNVRVTPSPGTPAARVRAMLDAGIAELRRLHEEAEKVPPDFKTEVEKTDLAASAPVRVKKIDAVARTVTLEHPVKTATRAVTLPSVPGKTVALQLQEAAAAFKAEAEREAAPVLTEAQAIERITLYLAGKHGEDADACIIRANAAGGVFREQFARLALAYLEADAALRATLDPKLTPVLPKVRGTAQYQAYVLRGRKMEERAAAAQKILDAMPGSRSAADTPSVEGRLLTLLRARQREKADEVRALRLRLAEAKDPARPRDERLAAAREVKDGAAAYGKDPEHLALLTLTRAPTTRTLLLGKREYQDYLKQAEEVAKAEMDAQAVVAELEAAAPVELSREIMREYGGVENAIGISVTTFEGLGAIPSTEVLSREFGIASRLVRLKNLLESARDGLLPAQRTAFDAKVADLCKKPIPTFKQVGGKQSILLEWKPSPSALTLKDGPVIPEAAPAARLTLPAGPWKTGDEKTVSFAPPNAPVTVTLGTPPQTETVSADTPSVEVDSFAVRWEAGKVTLKPKLGGAMTLSVPGAPAVTQGVEAPPPVRKEDITASSSHVQNSEMAIKLQPPDAPLTVVVDPYGPSPTSVEIKPGGAPIADHPLLGAVQRTGAEVKITPKNPGSLLLRNGEKTKVVEVQPAKQFRVPDTVNVGVDAELNLMPRDAPCTLTVDGKTFTVGRENVIDDLLEAKRYGETVYVKFKKKPAGPVNVEAFSGAEKRTAVLRVLEADARPPEADALKTEIAKYAGLFKSILFDESGMLGLAAARDMLKGSVLRDAVGRLTVDERKALKDESVFLQAPGGRTGMLADKEMAIGIDVGHDAARMAAVLKAAVARLGARKKADARLKEIKTKYGLEEVSVWSNADGYDYAAVEAAAARLDAALGNVLSRLSAGQRLLAKGISFRVLDHGSDPGLSSSAGGMVIGVLERQDQAQMERTIDAALAPMLLHAKTEARMGALGKEIGAKDIFLWSNQLEYDFAQIERDAPKRLNEAKKKMLAGKDAADQALLNAALSRHRLVIAHDGRRGISVAGGSITSDLVISTDVRLPPEILAADLEKALRRLDQRDKAQDALQLVAKKGRIANSYLYSNIDAYDYAAIVKAAPKLDRALEKLKTTLTPAQLEELNTFAILFQESEGDITPLGRVTERKAIAVSAAQTEEEMAETIRKVVAPGS